MLVVGVIFEEDLGERGHQRRSFADRILELANECEHRVQFLSKWQDPSAFRIGIGSQ